MLARLVRHQTFASARSRIISLRLCAGTFPESLLPVEALLLLATLWMDSELDQTPFVPQVSLHEARYDFS
jgi:hypothetical protein